MHLGDEVRHRDPNRPRSRSPAGRTAEEAARRLTRRAVGGVGDAAPCVGGAVRSLKMRGELTIFACSGCANGTRITSMRKSARVRDR